MTQRDPGQSPDPESPTGWVPPPGWGPPPGSAPPPGWGPAPGSAPPPGWGPAPAWTPAGQQDSTWGGQYGAPSGWGGPPVGAPKPGVVPLRPLGLGELLDGSVSIVRRYPRPTLGLSAVVAAISTALGVLLLVLLPDGLFAQAGTSQDLTDAEIGGTVVASLGTVAVTSLGNLVLSGVITAVVGRAVLGQPMTAAQAWAAVRPRLGRLLGVALLTGLIVGGTVALGVAVALLSSLGGRLPLVIGVLVAVASVPLAVFFYVRLSLASPVLVLEKCGVREALRRSTVLVRGSFWRVLGVLLLAALIAGAVGQVLQLPFLALGGGVGLFTGSEVGFGTLVLAQIGSGVAQLLTAPFSSGVRSLLYIDRRMRAEGLDVALAAAAAARRT